MVDNGQMSLSSSIATLLLCFQGVPSDVPKNHWAYGAIDELFHRGLLRGYPASPPLKLEKRRAFDRPWIEARKRQWKRSGYLVGYPDGLWSQRGPESRYELAVMVHATFANVISLDRPRDRYDSAEQYSKRIDSIDSSFAIYPDLARAISMLAPELTKLGADTRQMIQKMNEFRQGHAGVFRG